VVADGGPAAAAVAETADGVSWVPVDAAGEAPARGATCSVRAVSAAVPREFRFSSHQTMAMIKTMTMTQIIHSIAKPFIRHTRLPLLDGTSLSIGLSRLVNASGGGGTQSPSLKM
jgi:hypothetical protein